MDDTYDVWVDCGYEGWGLYEEVGLAEMLRLTADRPEQEVIVYRHKDRVID